LQPLTLKRAPITMINSPAAASTKIGDITSIRFHISSRTSSWQPDARPFLEILSRRQPSTTRRASSTTTKIRALLILVWPEALVSGRRATPIITGSSAVSNVRAESEPKVYYLVIIFRSIEVDHGYNLR
jgi:hypothetical protein